MSEQNNFLGSTPSKVTFLLGLLGGVAAVAVVGLIFVLISGGNFDWFKSDGGTDVVATENNDEVVPTQPEEVTDMPSVKADVAEVATYFQPETPAEVCSQDGKPIIRLFSTTWCPHCQWIGETFNKVAAEYVAAGKIIAYHWELDTGDDALTETVETAVPQSEGAIYTKFNPRQSIPTFVFGCKYFRIGNGYEAQQDLASEEKEFRALFDKLITEVK